MVDAVEVLSNCAVVSEWGVPKPTLVLRTTEK